MQRALFSRLCISLCAAVFALAAAGSTRGEPADPEPAILHHTSFVPMTAGTVPSMVFGVEMLDGRPQRGLDGVAQLGPAWLRRNGLLWKDVEPIEGRGYHWTSPRVVALESELIAASQRGLQTILVVRGSPRWATAPFTGDCAPVNAAEYGRYAAFLAAAVKRYSQPPYNVHYWEIGNEPDAPIGGDNMYGCWGIPNDPYYGGRAYGDMLQAVYPAIKAADTQAYVLNGSLLLDRPDTPIAMFFEGMLVAGAGDAFDILGFHSYCMFDSRDPDGHDAMYHSCADDWKVSFLRRLTRKYGIASKPLMRTETALLCSVPHQACRQQQADFAGRHYARSARDGLLGAIWFSFESDSFRHSALVEPSDPEIARPSYLAMKHAAAMFGAAKYLGPLLGLPAGAEGYRFGRGSETISIVWSDDQQAVSIPVAADADVACSNRDGQPVVCRNLHGQVDLTVGASPSYVVSR